MIHLFDRVSAGQMQVPKKITQADLLATLNNKRATQPNPPAPALNDTALISQKKKSYQKIHALNENS